MAAPLALPAAGASVGAGLARNRSAVKVGTGLVTAAGSMMVLALLATYINVRHNTQGGWPPAGNDLGNYEGVTCAITLIVSLFTMEWGVWAVRREERRQAYGALAVTAIFGIAFVNELIYATGKLGFGAADHPFGTLIYACFFAAGLLVTAATIYVLVATARYAGNQVDHERPQLVRAAGFFWHFAAFAWFAIFLTLYYFR